jgi:Fe-S cluster assembly scaffold protein SufB
MAVQMVVEGFFAPVMARIPFDGVRQRIASQIVERVG